MVSVQQVIIQAETVEKYGRRKGRIIMGSKNTKPSVTWDEWTNLATGEKRYFRTTDYRSEGEIDSDFHKVFMKDFLRVMEKVGGQKVKVICCMLKDMTPDNRVIYSYRQIAKRAGVSYQTTARTIDDLIAENFLRRSGKEMIVNPDILFKGRHGRRIKVLNDYMEAENEQADAAARLLKLESEIAVLTKEAERLKQELDKAEKQKEAES